MKTFLSFLTLIFFSVLKSQELKDFIIPKDYEKILETKGDLDKDGKEETIILFNTDKKIKSDFNNGKQREFFILKNINGKLKVWQTNSTIILASETGFSPENNPLPDIEIKNSCIVISQEFNTNSRHTQAFKYTFRFQNGNFYLIGSVSNFDDTCEFNILNEINFSTEKVIVDEQYQSCLDEEKPAEKNFHKEFNYKFKTIKMNGFSVGEHSIKIPNSTKYFNF